MNKDNIQYYKWNNEDYKKLFNSIEDNLDIKSLQFYMPFFSLYFYIHNTKFANKKIDLNRNYFIKQINEITKERYYNSNIILKGEIFNSSKNISECKEIFCKTIPILDPVHCINNNYNLINRNNFHLPSNYNYNTFYKINDINNTAYIDVFCSFLFSNLTYKNINPSFALYYGSANGIGDFKYDITEEYDDIKYDKTFIKGINKNFKLDIYLSDDDSDDSDDSDNDNDSDNDQIKDQSEEVEDQSEEVEDQSEEVEDQSEEVEDQSEDKKDNKLKEDKYINYDCIAKINNTPIQLLFIEKLEDTLESLLYDKIPDKIILSCIFQTSFALSYLQKHYQFTHNDLHINNIMYKKTDRLYFYYKFNNIYFKIPTYGFEFKIIDFGRANFTYKNKLFLNDVYSNHGEASGQYDYPNSVNWCKNNINNINTNHNYSFDLCRLSMTIIEILKETEYIINDDIYNLLKNICINYDNMNFCDMCDDFLLYITISRTACNGIPKDIILNDIFKSFRIQKKQFPRKSYYSL
jgi:hypothetical protein